MAEARKPPFGHEPPAIDTRRILGIGAALVIFVAVAVIGIYFGLTVWVMPQHAQLITQPAMVPPQPRLQRYPRVELAQLRAQKAALLSGYAWADPSHDFASIPIGRAMQIYAQEHEKPAPARKPGLGTRDSGLGRGASEGADHPAPSSTGGHP